MPKTSFKAIADSETAILEQLLRDPEQACGKTLHPDAVCVDEYGRRYTGADLCQHLRSHQAYRVRILQSKSTFFGTTVVVVSIEEWSGSIAGIPYARRYRLHRVWKRDGRRWQLFFSSQHDADNA